MTEPVEVETNPEIVSVEHPEPEVIGSDVDQPEADTEQPQQLRENIEAPGQGTLAEAIAAKLERPLDEKRSEDEPEEGQP